jgi:DnaJ like chaperone protein
MSWTGAGIGAGIGAIFGGPIGAGIGAAIGHFISGDNNQHSINCPHCKKELIIDNEGTIWDCIECDKSFVAIENCQSEEDVLMYLYLATFGLIAKIAKVDGRVSKMEAQTISNILNSFCENQEERNIAKNFYNEAKNDNNTLEYYAELLYSLSYDNEDIRKSIYMSLFEVASADGGIEDVEINALKKVLTILKLDINLYNELYDDFVNNKMSIAQAYKILECDENSSNEEIKKAYRNKVKEFHPDKIMSKDLPEAFIQFANEQMKSIAEAYEMIKKVRKF